MTAAASHTAPADVEGLQRISEIRGAKLPVEACRWTPDQGAANVHLLLVLGEVCGRVEENGLGGYSERGKPEGWLRLCDVDTDAIELVLSKIRRRYPEWRFDAGEAVTTLDKLDCHFATAIERRRRERAA